MAIPEKIRGCLHAVQVIMGESVSGKTTLLNIIATLDKPTSGEVLLSGRSITGISEREVSAFRRDNLSFVFQNFNLLDTFSIKDNILLPLVLAGKSVAELEGAIMPSGFCSCATVRSSTSSTAAKWMTPHAQNDFGYAGDVLVRR